MKVLLPQNKNNQNGQAVLIVLLIMTVILTIGLSVVSRSVTDIKISQQTQEAARAFWVAQAGLEKAIKANAGISSDSLNDIDYTVSKATLGGGNEFVFPEKVKANETVTLWFVGHDESTGLIDTGVSFKDKITLYWGNESEAGVPSESTPALEATLVYNKGGFKNMHYTYDPFANRSVKTNFTPAVTTGSPFTVSGQNFKYSSDVIDLKDYGTPYFLRLRLLFNPSPQVLGVLASSSLPNQGNCFESSATVSESGIVRKLKQCQFWLVSPNIFDYVLFSGGGI